MNFAQSVKTCFRKYAVFKGRASRSEYWWFTLFTTIVGVLLTNADTLGAFFSLAVFLPTLSVGVRRLHDSNRSGWWILLPSAIIIGAVMLVTAGFEILGAAAILGGLGYGIYLMVVSGTPGPNRYGEAPLLQENVFRQQSRRDFSTPHDSAPDSGQTDKRGTGASSFAGAAGAAVSSERPAPSAKTEASAGKPAADSGSGFTHSPSPFDDDAFSRSSYDKDPFGPFEEVDGKAPGTSPDSTDPAASRTQPADAQDPVPQQPIIPAFYAERKDDSNPFAMGFAEKEAKEPPMPKKRFCENCGAEIAPGSKFCTNCGTKL